MDARSVVVWLAVHDTDEENGCMWFIPGSHRHALREHNAGRVGDGSFQGNPALTDEDARHQVPIALKAGQAVFFSDLLLHGSPGNRSARPRGGFTTTYTSANNVAYEGWDHYGILCSGSDPNSHWKHNPRPQG